MHCIHCLHLVQLHEEKSNKNSNPHPHVPVRLHTNDSPEIPSVLSTTQCQRTVLHLWNTQVKDICTMLSILSLLTIHTSSTFSLLTIPNCTGPILALKYSIQTVRQIPHKHTYITHICTCMSHIEMYHTYTHTCTHIDMYHTYTHTHIDMYHIHTCTHMPVLYTTHTHVSHTHTHVTSTQQTTNTPACAEAEGVAFFPLGLTSCCCWFPGCCMLVQ